MHGQLSAEAPGRIVVSYLPESRVKWLRMVVAFALVAVVVLLLYFCWSRKRKFRHWTLALASKKVKSMLSLRQKARALGPSLGQMQDQVQLARMLAKGSDFDQLEYQLACTYADLEEVLHVKPAEPLLDQLLDIQATLTTKTEASQLLETCKHQNRALEEQRAAKERECDGLRLALQQCESDKAAALQRSQAMHEEQLSSALSRERDDMQRKSESYERSVQDLQRQLVQSQQTIQHCERRIEEMQRSLAQAQLAGQHYERRLAEQSAQSAETLQRAERELRKQLQGLDNTNKQLKKHNQELAKRNSTLEEKSEKLRKAVEQTEENRRMREPARDDLSQANLALRQDLDTARKENASLLSRLQNAESSATNLFLALEAEKKQRNSLAKQLKQTQKDAETWKKGQSALQKKLTQVQSQAASTTRKLQEWENSDEERCCVVCLENLKGVLFEPCQHVCTCTRCSQLLTQCPVCREDIQSKRKIFS